MLSEREPLISFTHDTNDISSEYASFKFPLSETSLEIVAKNVSYFVQEKAILKDVCCSFTAGKLVALMGPSGAGKTSLLNILGGRENGRIEGKILVNGRLVERRIFKSISNFIPQDDILFHSLTPRQTLRYAAELRLNRNQYSLAQRRRRVEDLLNELHLVDCADVKVGNQEHSGISGGQRKRVSIAIELLTNPLVIFVDEPTTGLDSSTALEVVQILRTLAHKDRIVICTIHQPSYDCLQLFDELLLLSAGRVSYSGLLSDSVLYFSQLGYEFVQYHNPAERFIDLLKPDGKFEGTNHLADIWDARRPKYDNQRLESPEIHVESYSNSLFIQFIILFQRTFRIIVNDNGQFLSRLVVSVFLALLFGFSFFQLVPEQRLIEERFAALFMMLMLTLMGSLISTIVFFPLERAIIFREYDNGSYNLLAYYAARVINSVFFQFVFGAVFCAIVYYTIGLQPKFLQFVVFTATISLIGFIGVTMGIAIGVVIPNVNFGQSIVPSLIFPIQLLSGFMIHPDAIPKYLKWLYYISFCQYSFQIMAVNEFDGLIFEPCSDSPSSASSGDCPYGNGATGNNVIKFYGYDPNNMLRNFLILIAYNIFFVLLGFAFLTLKMRRRS